MFVYRNSVQWEFDNEMQSFSLDTSPQSFCRSFIALSIIRCSKSVQKFAVWVRQVATVVMETVQLVRSQLIFTTRCHAQRGLCRRKMSVCPYFCQSVCHTPVFCRDIQHFIKLFSPSGMHTILVFAALNVMAIFQRAPPNGDVECRSVWKKKRFSTNISLSHNCCNIRQ